MDEYAAAVEQWNMACDTIRIQERTGRPVPEAWYARLAVLERQVADAERRQAGAQGALFAASVGRRGN